MANACPQVRNFRWAKWERRMAASDMTARLEWEPNPCRWCHGEGCAICEHTGKGPQKWALESDVDVLVYGGAAGGGKTACIAQKIRRRMHLPGFHALMFRTTGPEARDSIWKEIANTWKLYSPDIDLIDGIMTARHPRGGLARVAHLEYSSQVAKYMGGGYPFVWFDEATHFEESEVRFLFSRQRSATGIKSQLVLTCNPDGPRGWVYNWIRPWVDPKFPFPAKPREIRWFIDGFNADKQPEFQWFIDGRLVTADDPKARSIQFIPALLDDNQALLAADPTYESRLAASGDMVLYKQMREGDWNYQAEGRGAVRAFRRSLHQKSFAKRMGVETLHEAIQVALDRGWEISTGWDHGQTRERATIAIWNDDLAEMWVVGHWRNDRTTSTQDDALQFMRVLDQLGIDPERIIKSKGDIGNLGKGSPVQGDGATTINHELSVLLGFPISLADKSAGSVVQGVNRLNSGFHNNHLYVDESCSETLSVDLEQWDGGEAYKDGVDSLRYVAYPILRYWLERQLSCMVVHA